MANPMQPELRRSEQVEALSPNATAGRQAARDHPSKGGSDTIGPIPEDNLPGSHPDHEQDQPDPDSFAAKLGIVSDTERSGDPDEHIESGEASTRAGVGRVIAGGISVTSHLVLGPVVVAGRIAERVVQGIDSALRRDGRPDPDAT
jgi:hypothetical protein